MEKAHGIDNSAIFCPEKWQLLNRSEFWLCNCPFIAEHEYMCKTHWRRTFSVSFETWVPISGQHVHPPSFPVGIYWSFSTHSMVVLLRRLFWQHHPRPNGAPSRCPQNSKLTSYRHSSYRNETLERTLPGSLSLSHTSAFLVISSLHHPEKGAVSILSGENENSQD